MMQKLQKMIITVKETLIFSCSAVVMIRLIYILHVGFFVVAAGAINYVNTVYQAHISREWQAVAGTEAL